MDILTKFNREVDKLCRAHNVKTLYAFGSAVSGKLSSESDIDLIVDFEPIDVLDYSDNYYKLKFSLEDIFSRHVDLLEEKSIRNPYFRKSIDQSKKLIYGC